MKTYYQSIISYDDKGVIYSNPKETELPEKYKDAIKNAIDNYGYSLDMMSINGIMSIISDDEIFINKWISCIRFTTEMFEGKQWTLMREQQIDLTKFNTPINWEKL